MAAQLTQRWTQTIWSQAASLVADDPFDTLVARPERPRQKQTRLTPAQVTELLADYQSGPTVAAVARKYNINLKTATKHLVDHNVPIRQNRVTLPTSELPALLELRAAGWNNAQIGRKYGCSRQAVQLAFERAKKLSL